jgi:uridylate kinase
MRKRVLLKMSGEAIVDPDGESVISIERLDSFAEQVYRSRAEDEALEISIVVGAGNILRGKSLNGVGRTKADHMGMLATVINALALQDALSRASVESRVMTGIDMPKVAEPYIYGRAVRHLEKGRVVVFGGGTGNPYFTTDTAAALRAAEIEASVLLLAKYGTDGVYDKDPRRAADASKFLVMSYDDLLDRSLEVMDLTAVTLCKEHRVPIHVFDMEAEDAVVDALLGRGEHGTRIGNGASAA